MAGRLREGRPHSDPITTKKLIRELWAGCSAMFIYRGRTAAYCPSLRAVPAPECRPVAVEMDHVAVEMDQARQR